ncbi:MAG TPA: hypothetical protein VKH43_12035 [Thermoanaerobaculia bacterium]|nr:hypothetical protein [Thermoanaerobaculia bacterium]
MRILKWTVLVIAVLLVAAAALAAWKMGGPRNVIGFLRYGSQRTEGTLKVGDRAPDVSLVALDGKTDVRLAGRADGKPLVLVFGSYT